MNVKFLVWCLVDDMGPKICYLTPPSSMHRDETIYLQTYKLQNSMWPIMSISHKSFQRREKERVLPNSFDSKFTLVNVGEKYKTKY